ncbi:MAG: hypothetical protein JEZ02_10405 [Desulfatibacillum sp.]|nr:hypothetical protein [Desulfatibacillum sp.]
MKKMLLAVLLFIWALAPAFADIQVYDANGEYLGVLVSLGNDFCQVYVPSLGVFAQVDDDKVISKTCGLHYGRLVYETTDCTGTPYYEYPIHNNSLYDQQGQILKTGATVTLITIKSEKQGNRYECELRNDKDFPVVNVVEVESLPFSLPIQGPLEFRYSPNDTTGDGKTGLEEAIQALQNVANVP